MEDIISKYPSAPWDWIQLSSNPSVSFEYIKSNPQLPWNRRSVSQNGSVCEGIVRANPTYQWDWTGLCSNQNMSYRFFEEYMIMPDVVRHIDWSLLSSNASIKTLDIIEHPHFPWNDRFLSTNPNITSAFILNEGITRKWHPPSVSSNVGIIERDILKSSLRSLFDWDYRNLSANSNLPMIYVSDNISKDWNFYSISANASLLDVERFHKITWDAEGLSLNKNITFDYVLQRPDIRWNIRSLLTNSAITLDIILDNYDWFKSQIRYDERIETYMSTNESIDSDWVLSNHDKVDWQRLSRTIIKK
jgi:hypothetical protein